MSQFFEQLARRARGETRTVEPRLEPMMSRDRQEVDLQPRRATADAADERPAPVYPSTSPGEASSKSRRRDARRDEAPVEDSRGDAPAAEQPASRADEPSEPSRPEPVKSARPPKRERPSEQSDAEPPSAEPSTVESQTSDAPSQKPHDDDSTALTRRAAPEDDEGRLFDTTPATGQGDASASPKRAASSPEREPSAPVRRRADATRREESRVGTPPQADDGEVAESPKRAEPDRRTDGHPSTERSTVDEGPQSVGPRRREGQKASPGRGDEPGREAQRDEATSPPTVQVQIGRLEVRARPSTPPGNSTEQRSKTRPKTSLRDYLSSRSKGDS